MDQGVHLDTSGGLPLLLAEHRGSQTSYLVYGPQGTPIYQVTATGDVMYFHQDHLGSIRLVTNANGTTKGTLTYNAYGKPKTNTIGWLQEQPLLGYNSQYHDPETGYIYLRARHYDPTTSQFTTVDPLLPLTEEPYGYVGGDPANGADPSGLEYHQCPPGQMWSGASGGCVNGGVTGNHGVNAWTTDPYCPPIKVRETNSDPFPDELTEAADFLSPLPTDFIHTIDDQKCWSFMNCWCRAGLRSRSSVGSNHPHGTGLTSRAGPNISSLWGWSLCSIIFRSRSSG